MHPDLQGLEITKGEFRSLTSIPVDDILAMDRTPSLDDFKSSQSLKSALIGGFFIGPILGIVIFHLVYSGLYAYYRETLSAATYAISCSVAVAIGSVVIGIIGFFWGRTKGAEKSFRQALKNYDTREHERESLKHLFPEIQKYNNIVRAIDIKDQLEAVGNKSIDTSDRQEVVKALKLTREDLVRALKTEKILRNNRDFINQNPAMIANNLTAVRAIQISDRASEWSDLLNQALEVAVEVQGEMQRLQVRS